MNRAVVIEVKLFSGRPVPDQFLVLLKFLNSSLSQYMPGSALLELYLGFLSHCFMIIIQVGSSSRCSYVCILNCPPFSLCVFLHKQHTAMLLTFWSKENKFHSNDVGFPFMLPAYATSSFLLSLPTSTAYRRVPKAFSWLAPVTSAALLPPTGDFLKIKLLALTHSVVTSCDESSFAFYKVTSNMRMLIIITFY